MQLFLLLAVSSGSADEQTWNLSQCIDHALKNNISLKKLSLDKQSAKATYRQAKGELFPDVNFSSQYSLSGNRSYTQSESLYESQSSQSLRLSLNSGVTLFKGLQNYNTITQRKLRLEASELSIKVAENDIALAVTAAYLKTLYSHEAVKNAELELDASGQQLDYIKQLFSVGSSSAVELSQIQSQYSSDKYDLVVAENSLDQTILALKQLLEIPAHKNFSLNYPELPDTLQLPDLPQRNAVYKAALEHLPEMHRSELLIAAAELETKKSFAGYFPTLTASAGISSSVSDNPNGGFGEELKDNYNPGLGIALSFPIYDNRKTKTAHEQARISEEKSRLDYAETNKAVLQSVETAYQNVTAARERLHAAIERLEASKKSYDLSMQQFRLGMIKPTELLIEKNRYLSAQNEHLQAKYSAFLDYGVLNFYQGKPLALPNLR